MKKFAIYMLLAVLGSGEVRAELIWSTYLGGSRTDLGLAITTDGEAGYFVTGYTTGWGFPTTEGAFDWSYNDGGDAFIVRVSEDGSELLFSTFLGGSASESSNGLARDGAGGIVVAGTTESEDFPVTEMAFDRSFNDTQSHSDVFVARLSGNGNELLFGTYLGGQNLDEVNSLIPDGEGGVIVAGSTFSDDFPTTEAAFDSSNHLSRVGFISKLSRDGSELIFSTYLGGGSSDGANDIALDVTGGIIVTGYTYSRDFPTSDGAIDRSVDGGPDAFVVRMNQDGSELLYGTYIGGSNSDIADAVIVDDGGRIVVAGKTQSRNFPRTGEAFDTTFDGNQDAFVVRLSDDGRRLIYGTYLGGRSMDDAYDLTSDGAGGVIVTGRTASNNFPTTEGAFDRTFNDVYDGFVTRLSVDGRELLYSTYLGSPNHDEAEALSLDEVGGIVVVGTLTGDLFPISEESFDQSYNGGHDAFITRLDIDLPFFLRWTEMPGFVECDEGLYLVFDIHGESANGNANLSLEFRSDDIPAESARLVDHGEGSGSFEWDLGNEDAGEYHAIFTLSDDEHEIEAQVYIIINDINSVADFSPQPSSFIPSDAFPNPFNSTTTIRFGLPVAGEVSLRVADINGRVMATLLEKRLEVGYHEVVWKADGFAAGVYLVELRAGEKRFIRKVALTK